MQMRVSTRTVVAETVDPGRGVRVRVAIVLIECEYLTRVNCGDLAYRMFGCVGNGAVSVSDSGCSVP